MSPTHLAKGDVVKASVALPQGGRVAGISMSRNTGAISGQTPHTHYHDGHARQRQSEHPDRRPARPQDIWLIEKLAHFDREVIPERRMHAKGSGAHGTFTVTHDISRYTKAKIFAAIGKQTPMFARFSTVAGERGAAD